MLKELKVSGSGKSYTATVTVERESETGEKLKPETVEGKGKDVQSALANLKQEVTTNGNELQQFDEMAVALVLKDRIDKPTFHPELSTHHSRVQGYRSEQLEHGFNKAQYREEKDKK